MEQPAYEQYAATLSEVAQARRVSARADLEARLRATAEGDTGERFRDFNPRATAASLGSDTLAKFNRSVAELTSGGLPSGMANIIGEVLHIVPATAATRKASKAQIAADASIEADRLTDAERETLRAVLPERPRRSVDKLSDDMVLTTLDTMLLRARMSLRSKDFKDWPAWKQRHETLIKHGVYANIADALPKLPLSASRKDELAVLCKAAEARGRKMLETRKARERAARY